MNFTTRDGKTIEIRSCQGFDELDDCVRLQIETWGYADGDVIPRRVFVVGQYIGGQAIGAFDGRRMIGFAMALPAVHGSPVQPYLHSHMLAVDPAYRNYGVGYQLKHFQRVEALERGFGLMEWTFDPLEIKNAFLNIHKLGAIVRRYTPNFYGVSSSRLQGGLPTDRLHAEWYLDSNRVRAILEGRQLGLPEVVATITVPYQVAAWKASEELAGQAAELQQQNRRQFQEAFARGLAVAGYRRDTQGNGIFELVQFEHLRHSHL
ncbi:GNAT family N-acetyltransferase [Silvibacterium acidisoli]|uniref:GNAT family N-acetyltransferase n=1 Tax=Acidobacteriaceae bacterium ZG23-2 TaxID=2883246 RepID=UPI00406C984B